MVRGKFMFQIWKKIRMEGVKVPKSVSKPDVCKQLYDTFDNLNFNGTWWKFKGSDVRNRSGSAWSESEEAQRLV